jgi:hypothetical protein
MPKRSNTQRSSLADIMKQVEPAAAAPATKAKAKSQDASFQKVTTYLRKDTYIAVKRKLLDQGGGQISDVIQGLLQEWVGK